MREQRLAIHRQTVYALERPMDGAAPAELPRAPETPHKHVVATRPAVAEAVEKGIAQYVAEEARRFRELFALKEQKTIKEKKEREEEEKEEKRSKAKQEAAAKPAEEKAAAETSQAKATLLPKEAYFRKASPPGELGEYVHAFLAEAQGRELAEIETPVLVRHYLTLRRRALEKAISISFLDDIQAELTSRDINIIVLVSEAREKLTQVRLAEVPLHEAEPEEVKVDMRDREIPPAEAWKLAQRIQLKETFKQAAPAAAAARTLPDLPFTGDPVLDFIVDEANRRLQPGTGMRGPQRADFEFIASKLELVQRLVAEGRVPRDAARRILDGLETWKIAAQEERTEQIEQQEERRKGLYLERRITREEKRLIEGDIDTVVAAGANAPVEGDSIDGLFNRMFDQADTRPLEEFERTAFGQRGDFERNEFHIAINEISERTKAQLEDALDRGDTEAEARARLKKSVIEKFTERYDNELNMRTKLHNAFYIAATEGEFESFVNYCKQFASHYADLAFKDAPEVEAALRIRERVLYRIKEENGGFIPPELVAYSPDPDKQGSEWEKRTREILENLNRKGVFKTERRKEADRARGVERNELEQWRIDRAMSLSRGLGMVFLRFPEIVAEQPLYAPPQANQAWLSPPWEKIVWELNMLDYKAKKYNFGREVRAILYAMAHRKGRHWFDMWNQDELRRAIEQDAITNLGSIHGGEQRMSDMRNIFFTGGPITHTGWRAYVAALKADRSGLRSLLAQDPGLAMKMLYNRYEVLDQSIEKYGLFTNQNLSPDQKLDEFDRIEREGKTRTRDRWGEAVTAVRTEWGEKEIASWVSSSRRIPHVIWRIITDPANQLLTREEKQALSAYITGAIGVRLTPDGLLPKEVLLQLGEDITLAKENLMKRRRETVAAARARGVKDEDMKDVWTTEKNQLLTEDFALIEGSDAQERAENFRNAIVNIMSAERLPDDLTKLAKQLQKDIVECVRQRGFPFAVTAEDVPWNEFAFGQTGTRGYFTRKNNDAFSVAKANTELEKYLKNFTMYTSPEQYIEQLKKIYEQAEEYDQSRARDTIKLLAIGTIRFMEKDGIFKFPIVGEILMLANKARGRGSSFAETMFGGKMGAWDADDIGNFTEGLRRILTKKEIDEIRAETGGQWWQAFARKTKIAMYLLLMFFSYEMIERIMKEK